MNTCPQSSPSQDNHNPEARRSGRRRWPFFLLIVCLIVVAVPVTGILYLWGLLDRHGVDLENVQVESFSRNHLKLTTLQIGRKSGEEWRGFRLLASDVQVTWRWKGGLLPELVLAEAEELNFSTDAGQDSDEPFLAEEVLDPVAWHLPKWFPERVEVRQTVLSFPCGEKSRCELLGSGELFRRGDGHYSAVLKVNQGPHQLQVNLTHQYSEEKAELNARILANNQPVGELRAYWHHLPEDQVQWSGQMEFQEVPKQDWLKAWVRNWPVVPAEFPQELENTRLAGQWDFRLPRQLSAGGLLPALAGGVRVQAQVPEYVALPGTGPVRGELDLELTVRQGAIEEYFLAGDVQLSKLPGLDFLTRFPGLDPGSLHARVQGKGRWEGVGQSTVLLNVQLESQGELHGAAEGQVAIPAQLPFSLELRESKLNLQSRQVRFTPETVLHGASAYLEIQGQWQPGSYDFQFSRNSWISSNTFELPSLSLQKARLQANKFEIKPDAGSPRSGGDLVLTAENMVHPELRPQSWNTEGHLEYHAGRVQVRAKAQGAAGLAFDYELDRTPERPMQLDWSAGDIYMLAQNPLPETFKSWPEVAELTKGRLSAKGWVRFPGDLQADTELEVALQMQNLGGLYDRTQFSGLSGELLIYRQGEDLIFTSRSLAVDQLNPGIEIGPLRLQGSYEAPISDLGKGLVHLRQMELNLLGGRVWAEPVHFNLAQQAVQVPLLIRGLDLSKVLSLYPAEDLEGHGTVDGILPLTISGSDITVAEGSLTARPPGGVLKYRPAKVREMAQSDARMELLANVLENFHYSHLSGDINYVENGELTLGVQLRGRNPQMRESPPVNLTINLEENLPMLLASLQMAGDLSDTVKKRVSKALEIRARKQSQ